VEDKDALLISLSRREYNINRVNQIGKYAILEGMAFSTFCRLREVSVSVHSSSDHCNHNVTYQAELRECHKTCEI
jgi:hypothetical protein